MSLCITDTVTCPTCGETSPVSVYTSINADLNPDFKQRLLDGEFFRFDCPRCGTATQVVQDLLYHDMKKRAMFQLLLPGQPVPNLAPVQILLSRSPGHTYRLRLVDTPSALVEKIVLFDGGWDDRLVEAFKYALTEKLIQRGFQFDRLYFTGFSPEAPTKAIMRLEGPEEMPDIAVEFKGPYGQLRQALKSTLDAEPDDLRWRVVDRGYFAALVESGALAA